MGIPERFKRIAQTLAANNVSEGPMYDYVVGSLIGYDELLAHMATLEEDMLTKWVAAKSQPAHLQSAPLAISEIEATITDIQSGREEADGLLRALKAR